MTATEFSKELDVIYENINKNGAPGLDDYEKSVILSNAQEQLVRNILSQDTSASTIPQLITIYQNGLSSLTGYSGGIVFSIPTNGIMKVLNERVEDDSNNNYTVIPISNDQFTISQTKPYKFPRRRTAWRLGVLDVTTPSVEIFGRPNITPTVYTLRYVRKPKPIIVSNLTGGDTIDGYTASSTSELDISLHRSIVELATKLAEMYYYDKYGSEGNK